jgi:hypothetical protein
MHALDGLIGRTRVVDERATHWTTGDGRVIAICDMTDDHLRNTLRWIERAVNIAWHSHLDVIYRKERMTGDDIDEAIRETLDVCNDDLRYKTLVNEATHRRLMGHGI